MEFLSKVVIKYTQRIFKQVKFKRKFKGKGVGGFKSSLISPRNVT